MRFEQDDITITVERDYYCYADAEKQIYINETGTEVMVLYWNYSCPDGWGSVADEYIAVDDIHKLNQGLKELEMGITAGFEMEFYKINLKNPLIRIGIERVDGRYRLKLDFYDTTFDEYVSIDRVYTEDEWKPYADEFMEWGKKFPVALGDRAETLIHVDDCFFPLGRIGEVVEIYPARKKEDTLCVGVSFTDIGWDSRPYQNVRSYNYDQVRIIKQEAKEAGDDKM